MMAKKKPKKSDQPAPTPATPRPLGQVLNGRTYIIPGRAVIPPRPIPPHLRRKAQ